MARDTRLRLSELCEDIEVTGAQDSEVTGLTADSRTVEPGFLFAALAGSRADGLDHVGEAVRRGAVAVLAAPDPRLAGLAVPRLLDAVPRRRFAELAARFHPGQPDTVVAVTGTNGKSSVVAFARQLWRGLGRPAASLGTLGLDAPSGIEPARHTTPEPVALHRLLNRLAGEGVRCLALEASSHGLDQCRLDGVRIKAAAFTSFSRDHLDYHSTAEAYLAAKLRLFEVVMAPGGAAVLNADMAETASVATACRRSGHRLLTYGKAGHDLRLLATSASRAGQALSLELLGQRHELELPLVGGFQAMNVLAAIGLLLACGERPADLLALLGGLRAVPGRLQQVARLATGAEVFVDYAHTPDALRHALQALRPHAGGQLVVVFGCGGDRDRGKRPLMGEVAASLADRAIVTDDNPRGEDPATIRRAVLAGCPRADEIGDRREAIRAAIMMLQSSDILLIAGKGHETGQIVGDMTRPFDDAEEARMAVRQVPGGGL